VNATVVVVDDVVVLVYLLKNPICTFTYLFFLVSLLPLDCLFWRTLKGSIHRRNSTYASIQYRKYLSSLLCGVRSVGRSLTIHC